MASVTWISFSRMLAVSRPTSSSANTASISSDWSGVMAFISYRLLAEAQLAGNPAAPGVQHNASSQLLGSTRVVIAHCLRRLYLDTKLLQNQWRQHLEWLHRDGLPVNALGLALANTPINQHTFSNELPQGSGELGWAAKASELGTQEHIVLAQRDSPFQAFLDNHAVSHLSIQNRQYFVYKRIFIKNHAHDVAEYATQDAT
ncbi:hypothetical protein [Pseudomonas aeruginosa]|uniref:hypothetical protein n=1 Tax=Pseudomonas aeruginosa TaxID=287 RepID=UPI00138737B5|nr:hypothetical protein [Pseudomonas aeruginosa]